MPELYLFEEYTAECLKETSKALLLKIYGEEYWVPKACIEEDASEVSIEGDTGTVYIARWFAEKEGIE